MLPKEFRSVEPSDSAKESMGKTIKEIEEEDIKKAVTHATERDLAGQFLDEIERHIKCMEIKESNNDYYYD